MDIASLAGIISGLTLIISAIFIGGDVQTFMNIPGMMIVEGLIKKFRSARPKSQKLINILLGWDGKLAIDSSGGAAYEVLYFYLIKNMLEPKLGKELTVKVLGSGPHPLLLPVNELLGHATTAFFRIIQNSESKWVPSTESAVELIDKSLENACTWLENNLGFESSGWTWGQIHQASFKHSMSIKKVLDKIFSSGERFKLGFNILDLEKKKSRS